MGGCEFVVRFSGSGAVESWTGRNSEPVALVLFGLNLD